MDRKSIENLPRIHPILYHGHLYFVSTFPLNTTILPILLCKLNFFDAKSVPHFVLTRFRGKKKKSMRVLNTHKTRLQRTFCVEGRDTGLWSGILRAEINATDATKYPATSCFFLNRMMGELFHFR